MIFYQGLSLFFNQYSKINSASHRIPSRLSQLASSARSQATRLTAPVQASARCLTLKPAQNSPHWRHKTGTDLVLFSSVFYINTCNCYFIIVNIKCKHIYSRIQNIFKFKFFCNHCTCYIIVFATPCI